MSKRQHQSRRTAEERASASIATIQPQVVAGILLLGVAIFVAYNPALHGGFILDDDRLLTENVLVQAPDGLARIWFTTEPADYWPVANSSLWLEWRLWGTESTGYHTTNLVLHWIAALLIWAILWRLNIPGAFLAAVFFAVHPVNVESVAWISQRKGLLAAVFFLLSILCYVRAEQRRNKSEPSRVWYWLSLLAFVMAMLSKGSVAILPLVLLLVVWWLKRRIDLADVVRTAPFFLVAVVLTGVNVWFQTHGTDMVVRDASVTQRLLGASGVIWFYLSKSLAPVDLSFIYPQWNVDTDKIWWWFALLAASVVTLVLFLWQRKSPASNTARGLLFAWLFFCVALVPIMGFTDVGFMRYSLVADHYQYIAIIAVAAVAAATLRSVTTPVAIVVAGVLAFLTWQQSRLYADVTTLYRATLVRNPECWLIENNLGSALFNVDQLPEAVRHYRRALELNPTYAEAHDNLGVTLEKSASSQEAIAEFRETLRLKPDYAKAHFDLGHVLTNSGHAQEGIGEYQQAVRLNPNYAEAYYNLGLAFFGAGNFEQARQNYQEALRLRPDYVAAIQNLGNVLLSSGQIPAAIEQYQKVLRLQPENAEVHNNLGVALVRSGLIPEAVVQYELALRLRPDYASPRTHLGKALELARAQGLTELAQRIEALLNANGGQKNN